MSVGDFFAVDRPTWAAVCALGLPAAVAYVVLARGTGRDNRTTAWSVDAIERYTGIGRSRARAAISALLHAGLVERLREGARPLYRLVWLHEKPAPTLTAEEQITLDELRAAHTPNAWLGLRAQRRRDAIIDGLISKGWVSRDDAGALRICERPTTPDWIWLPNTLVTAAADECAPVELARQTQDVMTLRLLVDLYHAQNLRDDGGVHHRVVRQVWERRRVGQWAEFIVWGFSRKSLNMWWGHPLTDCHRRERLTPEERKAGENPAVDFFRRLGSLTDTGLLEWVPYLFDSDGQDAEPIHVYGGPSDSREQGLATAGHRAALSMLTVGQREWLARPETPTRWLAPVPRHMAEVAMIGVARLRYRPQTRLTGAWWAAHQGSLDRFTREYLALEDRVTGKDAAASQGAVS